MGKRYRTKAQRESDLDKIASYYLQGRTQRLIGEKIGLSQSMIAKELKVLIQRWQESALISFDEAKAEQLARIDHLESTYWTAWNDSTNSGQDGNPRFLEGVQRCIDRRIKILGLDAPTKISPTTPDGETPYESGAVFLIPDDGSPMPVTLKALPTLTQK